MDFKGDLINVEINSINDIFEVSVVPQIVKDALDLLADESLDKKDVDFISVHNQLKIIKY